MKKTNLLLCASLFSLSMVAQENKPLVITGPDVLVEYQLVSVSSNGKWACGNVNDGNYRGFVWDIENNDLRWTSALGSFSALLDIADDGTAAGLFTSTEATENGTTAEVPGYYKDGKWHLLPTGEYITSASSTGMVNGMSDNGRYIAGIATVNGKYRPVTWDIVGNDMVIWGDTVGGLYDVTNDGQMAAGYAYHPVKHNRTPVLWTSQKDSTLFSYTDVGMFSQANAFSPSGNYVLGNLSYYDVEAKKNIVIDYGEYAGFQLYRITDNGTAVGVGYDWSNNMSAVYMRDGVLYDLQTYLEEQGVELTGWTLLQCTGISADEKVFGVNAYDTASVPHPMIISLSANTLNPAPIQVKAQHLKGTQTCKITWKTPLAYDVESVKGYHVWRNGVKLTSEPITGFVYYDEALANGSYEYNLTAVYADSESDKSQTSTVEVADLVISAPRNVDAHRSGVRDLRLFWDAPLSNMPSIKYYESDDDIVGFGGGTYNFELATRFDAQDLAQYKNAVITDVCFSPMSRQYSWTANFYEVGASEPFYSEQLPTENLVYGIENTVRLKNPVAIPEGKDILMSIYVDVTGYGGYEVLGTVFAKYKAGYTDLIRREGEAALASLYETAMADEDGAFEYPVTWAMGICLGEAASLEGNSVASYKVYSDGQLLGSSEENKYRQNEVADGTYTYGISAVYGNGQESAPTPFAFTMTKNSDAYKKISDLNIQVKDKDVTLSWEAPMNDDETSISYANNTCAGGLQATADINFSYQVAATYDEAKLRGYEGYQITDVRFYPLADADFTFFIRKGDEVIAELPVDRGTGYTLGGWNTYKLDEPITVEAGAEYMLVVDCWDIDTAYAAPIGLDSQMAYMYKSDLYSVDDGETFVSLSYLSSDNSSSTSNLNINANWMIGMVIRDTESKELPVTGYKVYVDKKAVSDTPQTETTYSQTMDAYKTYSVRVDVVYEGEGDVKGNTKFVILEDPASIDVTTAEPVAITLDENATYVKINADEVSGIKTYNMAGVQVASATGNTLEISHLETGIYVLNAVINGKNVQVKISVNR